MKKINDGGSAFPTTQIKTYAESEISAKCFPGMTLRQWYAGQAMGHPLAVSDEFPEGTEFSCRASIAQQSFDMADAMLAHEASERNAVEPATERSAADGGS